MSQFDYRVALVLEGETPVNSIVIPDGEGGDKMLAENNTWIEVTNLEPMPCVGSGWLYVNGQWVEPV
jgi:hypothetical protein